LALVAIYVIVVVVVVVVVVEGGDIEGTEFLLIDNT
jgi:hypothetical protein